MAGQTGYIFSMEQPYSSSSSRAGRKHALSSQFSRLSHHHLIASARWASPSPAMKWLSNALPALANSLHPQLDEKATSECQRLQMLARPLSQRRHLTPLC